LAEANLGKAVAVAASTIVLIIVTLFAISFFLSALLDLPLSLGLPLAVRVVGGAVLLTGLVLAGWVLRYRSPADMVVSTYVTFTKLFKRAAIADFSGRTEPLVVNGPQKYVRHPLYLGVIVMTFGWALLGAFTFVLVASIAVLLWFRLVLIPFEERELRALFGDQYTRYMDNVPMLVPFAKRVRRSARSSGATPDKH
jgi:protein-S-isoprenylcysteine O-methyltransferase Ste14